MGQCRTLDADVTIGCYYGNYNSCDKNISASHFFFSRSHLFASFDRDY